MSDEVQRILDAVMTTNENELTFVERIYWHGYAEG